MTKRYFFLTLVCVLAVHAVTAQVYLTRNGTIRFFSEAPLENIEAVNRQVMSALNTETGEFVFRLPIRSFAFDKALMQEHFNDNFMESHTYPNASFQGVVEGVDAIDFNTAGTYDVEVSGALTIKDVTKTVREPGTLTVRDGQIKGEAVFIIRPEDYNISIPRRYVRNIASEIEVFVDVTLRPQ
ncbi:MAG: YceI family protein [Bacteroidales bacterium]|nr:YceI family protein [Bacteroidales bacterium]